jgi:MoxR-like ATPase
MEPSDAASVEVPSRNRSQHVSETSRAFDVLAQWLAGRIIGQEHLTKRLLVALLADGHLLVEGAPGLAKTRAIRELARAVEGDFQRIQFTPDLLPGDVTGTEIYRPEDGSFRFQQGPVFHNLVLADEINRAPAKVQSALLEAMAERQVSVGGTTHSLPQLFLVMATQNPIEHEGTYPLPEAQLDRFLLHVRVSYPDAESERDILRLARHEALGEPGDAPTPIPQSAVFAARRELLSLHMAAAVEEYIVQLALASREEPALRRWLDYGVSPRGTIALDRCARAAAWLRGRDFVGPDDVQSVVHDVFRHRVIRSFDAEAAGMSTDGIIDELLSRVPVG